MCAHIRAIYFARGINRVTKVTYCWRKKKKTDLRLLPAPSSLLWLCIGIHPCVHHSCLVLSVAQPPSKHFKHIPLAGQLAIAAASGLKEWATDPGYNILVYVCTIRGREKKVKQGCIQYPRREVRQSLHIFTDSASTVASCGQIDYYTGGPTTTVYYIFTVYLNWRASAAILVRRYLTKTCHWQISRLTHEPKGSW